MMRGYVESHNKRKLKGLVEIFLGDERGDSA